MGEAKVTLRIDVSEALESIRKVREGAKNVTSGGAGGGGRRSPTEQQILRLAALKKRLALQEERENLRNKLILDKIYKSQELHVIKIAALKKRLQHTEAAAEMKLNLMKQRHDINEERRLDRKNAKERRAEQERLNAIRREEREKTRIARQDAQRIRRYSQYGSAGLFNSTFQAGLTRLGGMGGGPVGGVLRNAVTGGFFGQSIGASAGTLFRGAGRNLGTAVGGFGGQLIGGLGAVLGTVAPVYGALKAAQVGATFTIAQAGFSAAVNVFSSTVGALARVVSSLVGRGVGMARNLTLAGIAGVTGVTGAGINAFGERIGAETGLRVVGGAYAPSLMGYGNQLANAPGQMFSRTSILQGITKASAFGMSPGLIRYFMPKMMNAAAVFGEDTAEGMRALARAAFQAEPEAAERFGLNLYERNIRQMTGNKYNLNDPNQKAMAAFETAAMQLRKFQGGMQAQRMTPKGAFQYVKNQATNLLEQIGGGFAEGFQLIPRLNQVGGAMGDRRNQSRAYRAFKGLGKLAGAGVDWISSKMPSFEQVGQFFSARDEKTKASEWGDKFRSGIASMVAAFRVMWDIAKSIVNLFVEKLPAAIKNITSNLQGSLGSIQTQILGLINSIHTGIGKIFSQFARSQVTQIAKNAPSSIWNYIKNNLLVGIGGLIGGVGGAIAGLPAAIPTLGGSVIGGFAGGAALGAGAGKLAQTGVNWLFGGPAQAQSAPGSQSTWQKMSIPNSWNLSSPIVAPASPTTSSLQALNIPQSWNANIASASAQISPSTTTQSVAVLYPSVAAYYAANAPQAATATVGSATRMLQNVVPLPTGTSSSPFLTRKHSWINIPGSWMAQTPRQGQPPQTVSPYQFNVAAQQTMSGAITAFMQLYNSIPPHKRTQYQKYIYHLLTGGTGQSSNAPQPVSPYQFNVAAQPTMSGAIAATGFNLLNQGVAWGQNKVNNWIYNHPGAVDAISNRFNYYKNQALGWLGGIGDKISTLGETPQDKWFAWQAQLRQQQQDAKAFRRSGDWLGQMVNRFGPNPDIIGGIMGVPRGPVSAYQAMSEVFNAQQQGAMDVMTRSMQAPQKGVFTRKNPPRQIFYGNVYVRGDSNDLMRLAEAV